MLIRTKEIINERDQERGRDGPQKAREPLRRVVTATMHKASISTLPKTEMLPKNCHATFVSQHHISQQKQAHWASLDVVCEEDDSFLSSLVGSQRGAAADTAGPNGIENSIYRVLFLFQIVNAITISCNFALSAFVLPFFHMQGNARGLSEPANDI